MTTIQVPDSPKPVGHYSHAIVSNGLLFTSGILPIRIHTSEKLPIEAPIERTDSCGFDNLKQILAAAGSSIEKVVKTTVYIADGEHWGIVNQSYAAFFGNHRPGRVNYSGKRITLWL